MTRTTTTAARTVTPSTEPFGAPAVLGYDVEGDRLHTVRIPAGSTVEFVPRTLDGDGAPTLLTVRTDYVPTAADIAAGYASLDVAAPGTDPGSHTVPVNRCVVRSVPGSSRGLVTELFPSSSDGDTFAIDELVEALRDAVDVFDGLDEGRDEYGAYVHDADEGRALDYARALTVEAVGAYRELFGTYTTPAAFDDRRDEGHLAALSTAADDVADRWHDESDRGAMSLVPRAEFYAYARARFDESGAGAGAVYGALVEGGAVGYGSSIMADVEGVARDAMRRTVAALVDYVDWHAYADRMVEHFSTVTFDGREYVLV